MKEEANGDLKDLIEMGLTLEQWSSLDEAGQERVRAALYAALPRSSTDPAIYTTMEQNAKEALRRFAHEYEHIAGLVVLGADFSIDLEFKIVVEHSLMLDLRRIPVRFLNFSVLHVICDVPPECLTVVAPGEKILYRDFLPQAIGRLWRRIGQAWGEPSLSENEILDEFMTRHVEGFVVTRGERDARLQRHALSIPWRGE